MPEELERKLRRQARKVYPHDKRAQDRYVYGTMRKLGFGVGTSRRAR